MRRYFGAIFREMRFSTDLVAAVLEFVGWRGESDTKAHEEDRHTEGNDAGHRR
jgi:hypothetical protein